eukprot:5818280-Karenia_brevis.AAC.1
MHFFRQDDPSRKSVAEKVANLGKSGFVLPRGDASGEIRLSASRAAPKTPPRSATPKKNKMPNPEAAAEAAEPADAAEAAQPSSQPVDAPMREPEPKEPEYIWRCCECGETYDDDDVARNGKGCCELFATVRKEALGELRDNDDKVLAENRDVTRKLLREEASSPVPGRIARSMRDVANRYPGVLRCD